LIITLALLIFLALLSLAASFVNGGLGYGYSSLSVPVAILVIANRIINPVYVLVEACMNTVMLGLAGKANIKATFRRVIPIVLPIVPGVIVGSYLLNLVAPLWVKFFVYAALLPLIFLQAAGFRKPIKKESAAGVPLGMGIGLLYSITTISGPPIALFWSNQGMAKNEFKAAVAQVRIAESYITCISYAILGLFTATTFQLFTITAVPVLLGIPLGMFIVSKIAAETFRRFAMAFNAGVVGFGLSQVFLNLFNMTAVFSYSFWALVIAIDLALLYRYMKDRSKTLEPKIVEVPVARSS
jgi:uncharacterized membrane protein YfcA